MKKIYILLVGLVLSISASAQCTDLFFSEYIEGSSNNKAIEIYNPSNSAIDLSDYAIVRLNGGSTSPDTFLMNGMLASADVYVIANSSADAAILAEADTTGSATFYNGDDALSIVKISTLTVLDVFGVPGMDPGSKWSWSTGSTQDQTLVRKYNTQAGVVVWDSLDWDVLPNNTFTELGAHSSSCHPPASPEVEFIVSVLCCELRLIQKN